MTTATRALYSTVDVLVLVRAPEQTCSVVENQQKGATHVKVWRSGQAAPEYIRNEDVMPLGQREQIEVL